MSIEFNKFLSYYKDSRDINLDSSRRSDDRGRSDRSDRGDRGRRDEGRSSDRRSSDRRDDRSSRGEREPWVKKEYGSRDEKSPRAERSDRGERSERSERSPRAESSERVREERPRRDDRYGDKPTPAKRGAERPKGKFTSLVINAGQVNKFNPKTLLTLINQYLPDQEAQIGKIDVQFSHTVFDVDEAYQDQVINAFKKAKYKGTKLVVDTLKKKAKG